MQRIEICDHTVPAPVASLTHKGRALLPALLLSCMACVPPVWAEETAPAAVHAVDPFLAGALGVIPFASGFYVTDKPERGLIFSLVDAMLILGIFSAREGKQQEEHNAKIYYGLIALNNAIDAGLSIWQANREGGPQAHAEIRAEGGFGAGIRWNY